MFWYWLAFWYGLLMMDDNDNDSDDDDDDVDGCDGGWGLNIYGCSYAQ